MHVNSVHISSFDIELVVMLVHDSGIQMVIHIDSF